MINADNNDKTKISTEVTLDVASAAMARRLIKRMKEVKDTIEKKNDDDDDSDDVGRKSWGTLTWQHLLHQNKQARRQTTIMIPPPQSKTFTIIS